MLLLYLFVKLSKFDFEFLSGIFAFKSYYYYIVENLSAYLELIGIIVRFILSYFSFNFCSFLDEDFWLIELTIELTIYSLLIKSSLIKFLICIFVIKLF